MNCAYPGSVHVTPDEALSIPHGARGCQDQPPFNQLRLPHPVLFYRTRKIGKIGKLSPLSQIGALSQPFFMIYVTFSLDREQLYSL